MPSANVTVSSVRFCLTDDLGSAEMTWLCSQVNVDVLDASETTHSGSACVAGGRFGAMLTCSVAHCPALTLSAVFC